MTNLKERQILIENVDTSLTENIVSTNDNNEKTYTIKGIFLQADVQNGNNRIYPSAVMDPQVQAYIQKKLIPQRAVGELEHPEDSRDQSINLRYVSHKITSLVKDGSNWIGEATITKRTPMGATVAGLMDEGVVLGVSSRASGSVKKSGNIFVVQNDFRLITPADIVADPSAPDAIVTSIMEGKEWVFENGILLEREAEEIQEIVNKSARLNKLDEAKMNDIFTLFLNKVMENK